MKVLLIGLGSIGQRHAGILQKHFPHELAALRSKKGTPNSLGIPEVYSWPEVEQFKPEAAFITNPTYLHVDAARQCARRGMHLFIEKPLGDRLEGVDELIEVCEKKKLTAYVAYGLRFHPVIRKTAELLKGKKIHHVRVVCSSYLHQWRTGSDPKKSYSAQAAQGGGVILDLSHEFDYLYHLFGLMEEIGGVQGRAGAVTVDAEDFCDAIVRWKNGLYANVHLNFLSHSQERFIKIDFDGGFLTGDLIADEVIFWEQEKETVFRFDVQRDNLLKEQTAYFFKNIANRAIMNGLAEAKPLLAKILEFRQGGEPKGKPRVKRRAARV